MANTPTKSRKLFLDASCLMELLYLRPNVERVVDYISEYGDEIAISALTVHLVYHFGLRDGYDFNEITRLVSNYGVLPIDRNTVGVAQRQFGGKDFEDCLQAACAQLHGCDEIVTLDKKFERDSSTKLKVTAIAS